MWTAITNLMDWLVSESEYGHDPELFCRARVLVSACFVFWSLLPACAGLYWAIGLVHLVLPLGVVATILALSLVLWQQTHRVHLSANVAVSSLSVGLVWVALLTGGVDSPVLWWIIPVPLIAGNMSGMHSSVAWTLVLSVAVGVMWFFLPSGFVMATPIAQHISRTFTVTMLVLVLMSMMASFIYFERGRRLSLRTMAEANMDLERARDQAESLLVYLSREKMRTERALGTVEAAKLALEESDRVKTEVLRMAAHDLRSPLNVLLGTAGLMADSLDEPRERLHEYLQYMVDAGDGMRELLDALLDLGRIEAGALNPEFIDIDAVDFLEACRADFDLLARQKNIVVETKIAQTSGELRTDARMLTQVLQNLISNAVKYSCNGSRVCLELSQVGDCLRFVVRDEGPGLSASDQAMLFRPFCRLSARPTGGESSTGLGLSIVKSLIDTMGGLIWCESVLGQGTAFLFELPCGAEEVPVLKAS